MYYLNSKMSEKIMALVIYWTIIDFGVVDNWLDDDFVVGLPLIFKC